MIARGCALARRLLGGGAVPSFSHELLVDLFRNRGELAPALLELCAQIAYPHDRADLASIDLSQVVSTEYRADTVVVLRDAAAAAVAAIVVEIQLAIDRDKRASWPVYVTALGAKLRCPVTLLVVTPYRRVARWARLPIELGHPGFRLAPVVLQLGELPRVTSPAASRALPELAVLSAMAHPEPAVALAAISALSGLPEDQSRLYLDVILAGLSPSLRKLLESKMKGYVYQSEFARTYYSQGLERGLEQGLERGLEQGLERGLEQGLERGLERGREAGLRTAVLALLRAKLDVVAAGDQAVIEAAIEAAPGDRLTELIGALARAGDAGEVRAVLAALRPAP